MKNWILALGALSLMGSACNPIVLDPLTDAPREDTPVVPQMNGGHGAHPVLAMRGGDVNWQENYISSPKVGPPWSDPDSLVLFFGSEAQECSNPVLAENCSSDHQTFWQLVLGIPPELARPGLIDLTDQRISAYRTMSNYYGAPECLASGEEGPSEWGTLELISDGTTALKAKLLGVPMGGVVVNGVLLGGGNLDGEYIGQICGALAAVASPTPALAIRGADLSPSPTLGDHPADDSLVIFLGTLPDTCGDPWAAANCKTANRLSFTLPVALQKPGVISLSDPAIAATYTVAAASGGTSACGLPAGPIEFGTVEILDINDNWLSFRIYQSTSFYTSLTTALFFDGLYAAPICP